MQGGGTEFGTPGVHVFFRVYFIHRETQAEPLPGIGAQRTQLVKGSCASYCYDKAAPISN